MDGCFNIDYRCRILHAHLPEEQNIYDAPVPESTLQFYCGDDHGCILAFAVCCGQPHVYFIPRCYRHQWYFGCKYLFLYHHACIFCDTHYPGRHEGYWLYRCDTGFLFSAWWIGGNLYRFKPDSGKERANGDLEWLYVTPEPGQ